MSGGNEGNNVIKGPANWGNPARDGDGLDGGGGNSHPPEMMERLAKLEGAFEGLKMAIEGLRHSQNMMAGAITLVGAFVIGFGVYTLQRIDTLDSKVANLPSQISSDLRDITKTLATSITATKQTPPQVILVPAPAPQTPANKSKP